jgi:chemotaxis protein CheC
MSDVKRQILLEEERDVLQEIMNIGFGSAAADLAQVIDIYVILSVPTIKVINRASLIENIKLEIHDDHEVSIVEQNFWSKFKGVALLVFSGNAGKNLLSIISGEDKETKALFESDPIRVLEKETLMEVGNILVGACVGKVAELLGDVVSYSPPRVVVGNLADYDVSEAGYVPEDIVIVMEAIFHFNVQDVRGYLFIITNNESINWLKEAIRAFLKQYE